MEGLVELVLHHAPLAVAVAAQHGFKFDTVQMPLNLFDAHFRSFGREVVPVLVVEDDAAERMSIEELIRHDDVEISTVGSGAEAIEARDRLA